jgi:hypothetical protein
MGGLAGGRIDCGRSITALCDNAVTSTKKQQQVQTAHRRAAIVANLAAPKLPLA